MFLQPDDDVFCSDVKTSVNVTMKSPSQGSTHTGDHTLPTLHDMIPGFKPFTVLWNFVFYMISSL